ncbi:MAG: helix-turn-helix domain-containing protein [Peptostreptococcaceae bacterium]
MPSSECDTSLAKIKQELLVSEVAEMYEIFNPYQSLIIEMIGYRLKHTLTQKELADFLNISPRVVAKIESGTHSLPLELASKILMKLGKEFIIVGRVDNDGE